MIGKSIKKELREQVWNKVAIITGRKMASLLYNTLWRTMIVESQYNLFNHCHTIINLMKLKNN